MIVLRNNKKKQLNITQKISEKSNIPFDMMFKNPYIIMCSNREIIVEDAGKLVHYDSECVKVMQRKNCIAVSGNNLKLLCLANNDIRVAGFINSVSFE